MNVHLKRRYAEHLCPQLQKELGLSCVLATPRLTQITLNMGLGSRVSQNPKIIDLALENMALIAGQRPVVCLAKRSVAAFKLRQGMRVGVKVTLRRERMYAFLDRLVTMTLPRIQNYRGNKPTFDGRGNYSMGLKDISAFYEVDQSVSDVTMGMDIAISTTAKTDAHCMALLRSFGIPFVGGKVNG